MYIVIVYSPQQAQLLQAKALAQGCNLGRIPTPRGLVRSCAYSYQFDEGCLDIVRRIVMSYNIKIHGIYEKVYMYGKESYQKIL